MSFSFMFCLTGLTNKFIALSFKKQRASFLNERMNIVLLSLKTGREVTPASWFLKLRSLICKKIRFYCGNKMSILINPLFYWQNMCWQLIFSLKPQFYYSINNSIIKKRSSTIRTHFYNVSYLNMQRGFIHFPFNQNEHMVSWFKAAGSWRKGQPLPLEQVE